MIDPLDHIQLFLTDEVYQPLKMPNPWIGRSVLQKAIRHGHPDLSARVILGMRQSDSANVWKRLLVAAFEEVGIGDVNPKHSFLKSLRIKHATGNWQVSALVWQPTADSPLTDKVIDGVETNDIGLAALAAHHLVDKYGTGNAQMVTIEITATKLVDGGAV